MSNTRHKRLALQLH